MIKAEIIDMYIRFAHTKNETTFIIKHGKERVIGTYLTVSEFWLDLDAEFEDVSIDNLIKNL